VVNWIVSSDLYISRRSSLCSLVKCPVS
jgi:hypothetical protein